MKKGILIVLGIFLNCLSFALAKEIELEKIVVTPYRTEILSETGSTSVEKIDISEMEVKGKTLLKEAISESSAVIFVSNGGLGGDTSIFLRGHNSYHTRFMLDSIKIYDPMLTSAYYNFAHFKLAGIENIEISKGPQSSLYGSDAIGGVINLISKRGEGKPKFIFQQKMGSFNTYEESLEFSGSKDNFDYAIGIIREDSGGFSCAKEKNNNHERDPYHNLNAYLNLNYKLSDKTELELLSRYIYAKYEYDGSSWIPPYLPVDDDDNYAYDYEGILGFILKQSITDSLDYKFTLSSTNIYRKGWEDSSTDYWYLGKTYQVDNQFTFIPFNFYKIIFGFDYLREIGDSFRVDSGWISDFPKETTYNKGYFLENIFNPYKNFLVSFSYRIDEHSSFKDKDTYRLSSSYLFEKTKTKLKASYGIGFKAPSLYQLYAPATAWGPIGNTNLKSEESKSYEAGFEQGITDNLKMEITYFHSQLKNLIDFISGQGYVNIGKARIKGIEGNINYKLIKNLTLSLGYAWMDTENKENHAELARRPLNKIVFKLKNEINRLTIFFDISYIGHRYSDTSGTQLLKPYILSNLALNYKLRDNLEIFSRFENILDEKYEEIQGCQTPEFSAYAGLKVSF